MTDSVRVRPPQHGGRDGETRSGADHWWDRARVALVVCWILLLVAVVLVGERTAAWSDVNDLVRSGTVTDVRVDGELLPEASGFATVDVHWRRGPLRYVATVRQVRRDDSADATATGDDISAIVRSSPSGRLAALHPGLHVTRNTHPSYAGQTIVGFRVSDGLVLVALLLTLAGLAILIGGPQPWRATRWAWFWWIGNPLGLAAFLLLSGPFPGLPAPHAVGRRLTGGWSFLLAFAVTSLTSVAWGWGWR